MGIENMDLGLSLARPACAENTMPGEIKNKTDMGEALKKGKFAIDFTVSGCGIPRRP